jgi:flagellar M-ring protein FliF
MPWAGNQSAITKTVLLILLIPSWLLVQGCGTEIRHDLDEAEATGLVTALTEQGIPAETGVEGRGDARRWVVIVPRSERARSLLALQQLDLPAQHHSGLAEVFDRGGLLPTPTEEQASLVRALQGELSKTLESVAGVRAARVHICLPTPRSGIIQSEPSGETTASVLLRYSGERPPLTVDQIKGIVAGAVTDLSPDRVTVVSIRQSVTQVEGRCRLEAVGPFAVSISSQGPLRIWLAATIFAVGLLGCLVVILALRLRRLRSKVVESG